MAKPKVFLSHKSFQDVQVKSAGLMSVSGEKYLLCKVAGTEKGLLVAPEYWTSPPEEVQKVFEKFIKIHLAVVQKKKAARSYFAGRPGKSPTYLVAVAGRNQPGDYPRSGKTGGE
jgi:hypothetical protein